MSTRLDENQATHRASVPAVRFSLLGANPVKPRQRIAAGLAAAEQRRSYALALTALERIIPQRPRQMSDRPLIASPCESSQPHRSRRRERESNTHSLIGVAGGFE